MLLFNRLDFQMGPDLGSSINLTAILEQSER